MLILPAALDVPYRVSIDTPDGVSIDEVTITSPASIPTLTGALTAEGGRSFHVFTPDMVGLWTIEVTAATVPIDTPDPTGSVLTLEVSARGAGDLVLDPTLASVSACSGHSPIRWPFPHLAGLDCVGSWDAPAVERWMGMATSTLFDDLCRRFPGCHLYAKLRPRANAAALCALPGRAGYGIDLFPTLRYPALELLDVEVDGASIGTADYEIVGKRYLVNRGSTGWPTQDRDAFDGADGSWSVSVRFGRMPPTLAVLARDRFGYSMLLDNEPTTSGEVACRLPEGTTQLVENGRTISVDAARESASTLYDQARTRWRCRGRNESRIIDPAEEWLAGGNVIDVVPGDGAPYLTHRLWLGSGTDLESALDGVTP